MPANGKNKSRNRKPNQRHRPRVAEMAVAPPAGADPSRYAVTAWNSGTVELRLPSGQLCLVQRVSVAKMVEEGIIDDFDSLSSLVQEKHIAKKSRNGGAPRQSAQDLETKVMMQNLMRDPSKLKAAMDATDRVVMSVVLMPKILPVPPEGEEREAGAAYIDWVDEGDKAFIMQFAFGGTRDLERFRHELAELGDGVDDVPDVEGDAK